MGLPTAKDLILIALLLLIIQQQISRHGLIEQPDTWSLSVEIQYYLLAPFILIPVGRCLNPLMTLLVISGLSWSFQTFIPYPTISFGLVFSRIWQFLIGSIVFYVSKEQIGTKKKEDVQLLGESEGTVVEKEALINPMKKSQKNKYNVLRLFNFVAIFVICFMPKLSESIIYESLMRLSATMLGGISIYLGTQSSSYGCFSLLINCGTYLGDISYSLYLIHWPLIILAKYVMVFDHTPLRQMLVVIFGLSIAQYHLFEKPMLRRSSKITFIVCAIIYGLLIFILSQPQSFGYGHVKSVIPENVISAPSNNFSGTMSPSFDDNSTTNDKTIFLKNEKMIDECRTLMSVKDCNWDPEMTKIIPKRKDRVSYTCSYNGTGNATIFVTGNSIALRQLAAILKALEGRYKRLYFAARPACLIFESLIAADKFKKFGCNEIVNSTMKFLEKFKPDIFIISERWNVQYEKALESPEAYLRDNQTIESARYLKMFSKFTQKIIVIEPNPFNHNNTALIFAKEIPQESHNLNLTDVAFQMDPGMLRLKAAMKECPKCVLIETRRAYIENGKYAVFDSKKKLSYFCDWNHMSKVGVDRIVSTLKKSFDQELKKLNF